MRCILVHTRIILFWISLRIISAHSLPISFALSSLSSLIFFTLSLTVCSLPSLTFTLLTYPHQLSPTYITHPLPLSSRIFTRSLPLSSLILAHPLRPSPLTLLHFPHNPSLTLFHSPHSSSLTFSDLLHSPSFNFFCVAPHKRYVDILAPSTINFTVGPSLVTVEVVTAFPYVSPQFLFFVTFVTNIHVSLTCGVREHRDIHVSLTRVVLEHRDIHISLTCVVLERRKINQLVGTEAV
jgi:hypothetical protein